MTWTDEQSIVRRARYKQQSKLRERFNGSFHERKSYRTERYFKYVYGWRRQPCTACNGSGRYDRNGSPKCGGCEGLGYELYRFKLPPERGAGR